MLAHTGRLDVQPGLAALISPGALHQAQAWGLATRLCRRFTTCAPPGLAGSALTVESGRLVLSVQPALHPLINEGVERDLRALAAHLGLKGELR